MPNDDLGNVNTTSSYKEKYSSMKDKLKHILYENELYHDELIRLKRELIDIYSDKDILINRIIESGVDLGTSDDDENDGFSQFSDIAMPASTSKCNNINISTNNQNDSDATSRIITLTADPNVTTISTTMTTAGMPTIVMTGPAKTPATQTTETTGSLEANKTAATNSRAKPKGPAAPRSRAKAATATNSKAATTKATTTKSATASKAASAKVTTTKAIKPEAELASISESGGSVTTVNSDIATAVNDDSSAAKPKPKRKRPTVPKKTAAEKKAELEQQQQPDNQASQQQPPLVTSEEAPSKPAKPPAPKRVRKPAVKKPKLTPQTATPHDIQHSPMIVTGQVQLPVSLPNEQIKFVQHVNLPEQNLIGNNGNIILTNHAGNQIQVQQIHHFQQQNNQSHHRLQDTNNDNNNHQQMQIQLPQTTTSTMESFQTPQSIITTSQGGQQQLTGFGQHQSYTIVATNGNLIQHDLNQDHSPQPTTVQLTTAQSMSLSHAIQQQNNGSISAQTIRSSNMQTHQGMPAQQETIQTINFQPLQHNPNGQQQHTQSQQQQQQQQQQDDSNNYGSHQIIQFELPRQIQLAQVSQHQQQIHHQLQQMQPQQQQQQMQMQQQMTPIRSSSAHVATGTNEELEQRRIEQQAAALLMNDWESSVASELFGSDSIKFMAED